MTNEVFGIWEPRNLSKIESALQETIIFGVLDRRGDTSPHQWACLDFDQFKDVMTKAQPVDWYVAWSIKELADLGLVLAHAQSASEPDQNTFIIPQSELDHIRNYLSKTFNEIITVFISWDTRQAKCQWGDIDGYDEFLELLKIYGKPNCEVYVFPLTMIDKEEILLVKTKRAPGY